QRSGWPGRRHCGRLRSQPKPAPAMKPTKLLIDSHVFIWLLYEPEKVSPKAQQLIQTADAVYISLVTPFELALKFDKKKLAYSPKELAAGIKALNLQILPLETEHIVGIAKISLT